MNTNMKSISYKIIAHIKGDVNLFSNVSYDTTMNTKKAEKFGMASVTTLMQVTTDKDGNALEEEKYLSITLYVMEKLNGTEVLIVNDDTHDLVFNSYGFDKKPENFDDSKKEFIPITEMVVTRLCSYIDTTVKWAKKYPKENKDGKEKKPFNKKGKKNNK